ncbi:MAG: S8 family serine peptidase, partial [Limisphaerales bacterium]
MRSRPLIWILLCLLLAAGVWLFWPEIHPAQKIAARKKNLQHGFVAVQSISPKVLPASMAATNALALTKTNEFAYRLTNTKKTIGELENDPHAILLENAFIDTSEPLNLNIPKNLQAQGDPGEYIVQANGVINNAFRAMLAAAGGRIISYIPNDAFLAQLSPASAKVVANNPMTAAVIPYEPYYKMPPSFLTALSQNPDQPLAVSEMQVAAFPGAADEARAALENLGAKIIGQESSPFGDVFTIQNVSDVTALARLRVVQLIEPFHTRVVANDLARVTLGISTNTTTAANYMGLTGKNVIVEVNDTGIDANHPDLTTARIFGDTVESLVDTNGHGTHVAGIIASSGINSKKPPGPTDVGANARGSVSGADFRGKAPAADLYSIVALGGTNFVSDRYLQESAAKTNALISNNSWILGGDNAYDLTAASYDAAVRDALPGVTGSQPVLFVFAAGDDGNGNDDGGGGDPDTVLSPATAKNVITVGALEQLRNITNIVTDANSNSSAVWQPMTDSADQVAGYSSRGNVGVGTEGTFGRFKPDVVAPGSFVVSTRSGQWDTNAYYNPTNYSVESASDVVTPDSPNQYSVSVPANAAEVDISITANSNSPSPFPDFPIYVKLNGTPSPTSYDFVKNNNQVKIPPDGGGAIAGIQSIQNGGFNFAIADGANVPASYDVKVEIISTNDYGDYYSVLEALNETLAPYYRYESGTSMSAPAISGVLALMQDYFTNTLAYTPSPALLKAMLINGSRAVSNYRFAVTNSINFQGWGLANLTNSLPLGITNAIGTACSSFFLDQSPVNALATGDSHTFAVTVTNLAATILPLRVTLAWTDPPGDPAAAIKLVNNLDLIVSNSVTGKIYYGNNFLSSGNPPYSIASNPTNAPALDSINNVENVFIPPLLSQGTYYVTVVGRSVNVNAVTAQTNNVVQDFALVISLGNGQMTNAMTVTDGGVISNPTGDQDITYVAATNTPLLNQFVGANTPLLGTNAIPLAGATNGQITLGMTNQWHFYVVTNTTTFTNAAFITFLPDTLAIPRMGVFANSDANATRPEADIDLYVTRSSVIPNAGALTNLDPTVIAAADKSLTRSGTEFVAYTNAQPNEVFYIGVKSEDHEGAEYDLIPIFTQTPFSQIGPNGDEYVNALNVPIAIPDGTPSHPGTAYVFALALQPITVQRVVVTNLIVHQNFGDLIGTLSHNGKNDVLNNHNGLGNWPGTPIIYDDSGRGDIPNSQPSDGPGSLQTFQGDDGSGVWRLTEIDDALTQTGTVTGLTFFVEKHQNPKKGINVVIQPSTWFYTYIDVPAGITNLQIFATNLTGTAMSPLQLYLRYGSQPDQNNYDFEAGLTNGVPPGNMISDGPPLITPGRYFIGIFNPSFSSATVFLLAVLNGPTLVVQPTDFKTNGVPLLDDAVTNSSIFISATNPIASIDVGMVVQHPRISDLTFTLVSPSGQRILLMENRGGLTATNAGHLNITTNFFGNQVSGGPLGNTNVISFPYNVGTLVIDYNFETIPDSMDVYYDGVDIFSTFTNNPGNPPVDQTFYIPFGPGVSTNITIVMNQNGNADTNTAWTYTPYVISEDYNYLTFTEDTNLTDIPIKFAIPPFDLTDRGTNYALSDFELATNGDYFAPTNIFDPFGGWYLPTNRITLSTVISNVGGNDQIFTVTNVTILTNNEVSVVNDPANAFVGSNFLALANGFILRTNFMTPQRKYTLTYLYRGPGISGWWRGEGNALDSADPERLGQNGSLIGRFDFPAGEVGQAFQMENNGSAYDFAGTNSYVQIRQAPVLKTINSNGTPVIVQSSALDVGTGSGFTIEGWINPTNVSFQQPLVEWLARVPTNGSDTNLTIEAGPFLDRATGHYYYLLNATNWTTSELWATQLAGHLATIDTANEENWVYDTFANFGGTNRALWIGLNDATNPGTFVYSSGLTDVTYTNWANGQPDECTGAEHYVAIINPTNALSGLWMVADNNGIACTAPKTNTIYGVVEVDDIQTNGVQFWISVTNQPGTTNSLVSSNGCLYANLVDTTNGDHIIFSAPDLVQSNLYQHVALTYDTNSGIANLYYDGTNVATTNFGVAFIPKTTGDVLLGKDMSRETNNFYGGKMDEMSI